MLDTDNVQDLKKFTKDCMRGVRDATSLDEIEEIKTAFVRAHEDAGEVPYLSDLIVNIDNGAQPLMEAIAEREERDLHRPGDGQRWLWTIQVLCDEWGNKPRPGDKVERVVMKGLYKRDGIPVPSTDMSRAKIDGSYSERFEDRFAYPVDNKGCAKCGFTPAGYFLNAYGVHSLTGYAMCRKSELSSGPSKAPNGQMLHVHYWRYKEMDAAMYAALPLIEKTDAPKRGK